MEGHLCSNRQPLRKYYRFNIELPARINILLEDARSELGADLVISNISAGGAFFSTDQPFPGGTRVRIELLLPSEKIRCFLGQHSNGDLHIVVMGIVMRSVPQGMAISFDEDYQITPLRESMRPH